MFGLYTTYYLNNRYVYWLWWFCWCFSLCLVILFIFGTVPFTFVSSFHPMNGISYIFYATSHHIYMPWVRDESLFTCVCACFLVFRLTLSLEIYWSQNSPTPHSSSLAIALSLSLWHIKWKVYTATLNIHIHITVMRVENQCQKHWCLLALEKRT